MRAHANDGVPAAVANPREKFLYCAEAAEAASVVLEFFHAKPETCDIDEHIGLHVGEVCVNGVDAVFFYDFSESPDFFFDGAFAYRCGNFFFQVEEPLIAALCHSFGKRIEHGIAVAEAVFSEVFERLDKIAPVFCDIVAYLQNLHARCTSCFFRLKL